MGTEEDAAELLSIVVRRRDLLRLLSEAPRSKAALVDELDVSRSTVDRAIRDLEAVDVVTYADGGYTTTPVGDLVAERSLALLETLAVAMDLRPVLRWIPRDALAFDPALFADADVWTPDPDDPYAMVNRHVAALAEAAEARLLLPVAGLHAHETLHERVVEADATFDLVVSPGVAETLTGSEGYASLTDDLLASDRYSLSVYEGSIPYYLGVLDDVVQIGVDEDGDPRALAETSDPDARAWAARELDAYEREAVPIAKWQ